MAGASRRELVVIIDGGDEEAVRAWSWGHEAEACAVQTSAEMIAKLGAWVERGHEVLAVQGSDAFLGRVLTCVQRHYRGGHTELKIFALPATRSRSHVADWLGESASMEKRARYVLKATKKGSLKRASVSTLRVSNSMEEGPCLGFNFATGLFYELALIAWRGGLSGATQLASMGVGLAQRARAERAGEPEVYVGATVLARERRDVGRAPLGVLCGALPRALFDVALSGDGGARVVSVEREAEVAALVARARAPLAVLRGEAGEAFGVLHFDRLEHYVFDGEDHAVDERGVVQVTPGPEVVMWC